MYRQLDSLQSSTSELISNLNFTYMNLFMAQVAWAKRAEESHRTVTKWTMMAPTGSGKHVPHLSLSQSHVISFSLSLSLSLSQSHWNLSYLPIAWKSLHSLLQNHKWFHALTLAKSHEIMLASLSLFHNQLWFPPYSLSRSLIPYLLPLLHHLSITLSFSWILSYIQYF